MKNLTFLLGITLLLFGSCSNPGDYNTSIMNEVVKVENEVLKIAGQFENGNLKKTQINFREGKEQTKASLEKLENMSAFRDDDALRQAAIKFVKFYDELFTNEYQVFINFEQELEIKNNLVSEQYAFIKKYGLIAVEKE